MPANHARSSRRNKQHIKINPRAWIDARTPLTDNQKTDLGVAYHIQLQAMLRGEGTEEAWGTLACSMNIAMVLCEKGYLPDALPAIQHGQDALLSCRARQFRAHRWGFNGEEITALKRALQIHDEQLNTATKGHITYAVTTANERMKKGEVLA